jgi:MFS transporter
MTDIEVSQRAAGIAAAAPPMRAEADRVSRNAAIALGLTLPGDTVLYLLLPLHAAAFGVNLPEAGILLAANRLVRIAGYGWVARGFERYGARGACVLAALGAAASTFGYATLNGLWALIAARLLWGLSFAALNIATQALATVDADRAARRSGRQRAIISTGPMLGLLTGAALAEAAGPRVVFLALAAIALLGVPFALLLPAGRGPTVRTPRRRFGVPAPLDIWSFVQGLTLDGIFVVGLSVLAAAASPKGATLAAGAALSLRYLAEIVLGPPSGVGAERWGVTRALITVSLASCAGYAAICGGWIWTGIIAIVLLRGVLAPLPAPVAARIYPGGERVPAIARLATWRDLGAGIGPMLAGLILPLAPTALYAAAGAALAAATLFLARSLRGPIQDR